MVLINFSSHGKFSKIPWNSMEKYNLKNPSKVSEKIYGIPWKFPWNFPWKFSWNSMEFHGISWKIQLIDGTIFARVVITK
jgi:hypothetical protein